MKEYNVVFAYSCIIEADDENEAREHAEKMLRERLVRTEDLSIEVEEK